MKSQSSDSTSRSLLRRAREHDPAAWDSLTAIYGPLVYQWCRRAGLQASDAADVGQEVFQSVANGLDGFRKEQPGDSFRGWLWTITRHKIHDHFRSQASQPDAQGGSSAQRLLEQLPGEVPRDEEDVAEQQTHSSLARRAIALMKTDFEQATWQAFWSAAVEQQAPKDVAEQLGLSVSAVYMSKSRVLRRLREELEGLDLID